MAGKNETGKRGEELALAHMEKLGLHLLDRNWRNGHREIDLVMGSPGRIHIVEVKTLTAPLTVQPFEKVDVRKRGNLVAAARSYLAQKHLADEVQFDVVSVVFDGPDAEVEYIPEAFFPIMRR